MVRKLFSLVGLFLAIVTLAQAQTGTVTGKIIDNNGFPLIGANVVVKGTTIGTITDIDGNYTLSGIPNDASMLVASFIGYANIEQTFTLTNGKAVVNFTLVEDIAQLDELIVIGYGTQKKEDKTGAVAHIKADEMNGGVLTDPLAAIAGKAAGVVVTKGGGDPNSDVKIKIRGSSGISGKTDTNPLYVIDGIAGADPNMVAPEDIDTYNILKDAASTAIYGSRGANGVIIITTRKGASDNNRLAFNSTSSIDVLSKKLDLFNAADYRTFADYFFADDWTDGGTSTDWQDEIFRTGFTQNTNLSASGGNEKGSYYASVTHSNWQGVIKGSSKERTIGNLKIDHKAFNDRLTLSGNMAVTFEKNDLVDYGDGGREDVLYQAYRMNPTDPVYNIDGSFAFEPVTDKRGFNYINPVGIIENVEKNDSKKKILASFKASYEITNDLIAAVNASYLSRDKEYRYFRPVGVYGGQGEDNGAGSRWYELDAQKSVEATLNYNKSFNSLHNLTLLTGYSWQENSLTKFGVDVKNSQSPSVGVDNLKSFIDVQYGMVQSEARKSNLVGFFGRVNYDFNSKYYLSASLRTDGSSKFGANEQWGVFPTASISWNMHNEAFMSNLQVLNQFKLRASYGVSGNQAFDPYYSQTILYPSKIVTDPVTGKEVLTWSANRNANPDLKWEQTSELNIGVDYALFNSRISGSIEYYSKTTNDLINEYSVPSPPYIYPNLWANSGVVLNQGIEFFVMATAVDKSNFHWKTTFAASHNKGKVTDLGRFWAAETDGRVGWLSGDGMVGGDNWTIFIEEDQPLGNFYLYEFAYFQDGNPYFKNNHKESESEDDFIREKDLDINDRAIVGNATPDIELSWGNNITLYKNFSIDFSFRALLGQQVYNHTTGFFSSPSHMPARNLMENSADYMVQGFQGTFNKPSTLFLEDASFLRLDYLSFGYNFKLNDSKNFKSLKLSVSANNLFVLTGYSGSDPEMTIDGLDYGVDNFSVYPKTRTFSFGINATF